jgi:hypothetical protein
MGSCGMGDDSELQYTMNSVRLRVFLTLLVIIYALSFPF